MSDVGQVDVMTLCFQIDSARFRTYQKLVEDADDDVGRVAYQSHDRAESFASAQLPETGGAVTDTAVIEHKHTHRNSPIGTSYCKIFDMHRCTHPVAVMNIHRCMHL